MIKALIKVIIFIKLKTITFIKFKIITLAKLKINKIKFIIIFTFIIVIKLRKEVIFIATYKR